MSRSPPKDRRIKQSLRRLVRLRRIQILVPRPSFTLREAQSEACRFANTLKRSPDPSEKATAYKTRFSSIGPSILSNSSVLCPVTWQACHEEIISPDDEPSYGVALRGVLRKEGLNREEPAQENRHFPHIPLMLSCLHEDPFPGPKMR